MAVVYLPFLQNAFGTVRRSTRATGCSRPPWAARVLWLRELSKLLTRRLAGLPLAAPVVGISDREGA